MSKEEEVEWWVLVDGVELPDDWEFDNWEVERDYDHENEEVD